MSHWDKYKFQSLVGKGDERIFYGQKVGNTAGTGLGNSRHYAYCQKQCCSSGYVFEFLGIPENKPVLESELEKALVRRIEDFMLELGRGFMFVGTQQRVTLNNTHY